MRDDRERENDPLLFLALFLSLCRIDDQTLEHHHQHHADLPLLFEEFWSLEKKKRPAEKSFLRRKKKYLGFIYLGLQQKSEKKQKCASEGASLSSLCTRNERSLSSD